MASAGRGGGEMSRYEGAGKRTILWGKKLIFCRNIQYGFYIIEKIIGRISHIMQKEKKSETWTLCDKMKKTMLTPTWNIDIQFDDNHCHRNHGNPVES